ncbi:MAG: hypothetical protein Q7T05_08385 [Dehalococcoidia bacterium]|nr:hypothetical protein [Dehalococcoidia bacterium]
MKRFLLAALATMAIVSGVAAVSAFESSKINVKAHVENALTVDQTEIDFGTVFPEEVFLAARNISLSESALAELGQNHGDLQSVTYKIFAESKPHGTGYYEWLGEGLYVGIDVATPIPANMTNVGPRLAPNPSAQAVGTLGGTLSSANTSDVLNVCLDVPVFEAFYNSLTDPRIPSFVIPVLDPRHIPDGVDLGLDLKVQVMSITRVP